MALANFFDKVSFGASQILQGFDRTQFENLLLDQKIMIFYDTNAVESFEGKATLDMLVRLLSRLYPNLLIHNCDNNDLISELEDLASSINPNINLSKSEKPTSCIIVGNSICKFDVPVFYVGSDNWITKFSRKRPVGSSNTSNPFAAGAAACFGAANIFRKVFHEQLPYSKNDDDFSISILDFSTTSDAFNPIIGSLKIKETVLVGLGAIGNGVLWAMGRLPAISGKLTLIDNEEIEISNLQRYVLADQISIGNNKVGLGKTFLDKTGLDITVDPITWQEYIIKRSTWDIETIAVCVDNKPDRISVQGALPKNIFNAWTQQENIGVSRHTDFINSPCLCCLYFPIIEEKSISQEIADSLNLSEPEFERIVRDYLANSKPVDQALLSLIVEKNNLVLDELDFTLGKSIEIFYSEVICGGILMKLKQSQGESLNTKIEVPSVFESAFAGILLAAEIVNNAEQFRKDLLPTTTRFNLMRVLTPYLNFEEHKKERCICNDAVFQKSFNKQWIKQ